MEKKLYESILAGVGNPRPVDESHVQKGQKVTGTVATVAPEKPDKGDEEYGVKNVEPVKEAKGTGFPSKKAAEDKVKELKKGYWPWDADIFKDKDGLWYIRAEDEDEGPLGIYSESLEEVTGPSDAKTVAYWQKRSRDEQISFWQNKLELAGEEEPDSPMDRKKVQASRDQATAELKKLGEALGSMNPSRYEKKEPAKSGHEMDVVTKAPLKYLDKPGVKKSAKKAINKRARQGAKADIQQQMGEKKGVDEPPGLPPRKYWDYKGSHPSGQAPTQDKIPDKGSKSKSKMKGKYAVMPAHHRKAAAADIKKKLKKKHPLMPSHHIDTLVKKQMYEESVWEKALQQDIDEASRPDRKALQAVRSRLNPANRKKFDSLSPAEKARVVGQMSKLS